MRRFVPAAPGDMGGDKVRLDLRAEFSGEIARIRLIGGVE